MAQHESASEDDLFLELAQDRTTVTDDSRFHHGSIPAGQPRHLKHHSVPSSDAILSPAGATRRPKSSGHAFARPQTSYETYSASPYRFERRQSPLSAAPYDHASAGTAVPSSPSRHLPHALATELSPASPRSTSRLTHRLGSLDVPTFGRRRPSLQAYPTQYLDLPTPAHDSQDESPPESSGPRLSNPDSASAESQTAASTVWDELDDLKSRIKKLELTGKIPATSGAAVANAYERPRTATTAPTTVDSSPKHERHTRAVAGNEGTPKETPVINSAATCSHPLLYAALAKARPLINSSLYRVLEATTADALQLASLTGSGGPQGTTFSAASIINGVTASDRHIRRKADSMCRNLTDLCIALSEGKHEAGSVAPSPVATQTPSVRTSPTVRPRHASGERGSHGHRATSRLEARRTSILGLPPTSQYATSSYSPDSETRTFDQESTVSYTPSHAPSLRRTGRPNQKLRAPSNFQQDERAGDEDATIRPPSRAMTDFVNSRRASNGHRDSFFPGQPPSRSPSLREKLAARRSQTQHADGPAEAAIPHSSTLGSRLRRITDASLPASDEASHLLDVGFSPSEVRRRQSASNRTPTELSTRSANSVQRRRWMLER